LAVVGIVLLSWPKPEAAAGNTVAVAPPLPYLGELLTVAGALIFTAEILCVHHYGQHADAVRLTFVMLCATSVLSLGTGAAIGGGGVASIVHGRTWAGLGADWEFAWTVGSLVVGSSVVALHLMNVYQPRVSPAVASVVYCTEPLFGTVFSLVFATERLTVLTAVGGAVVIVSVLVVARSSDVAPRGD
jgi:drug/metabolite transporter (DMT)-like permease